ncbi:hypothetical protein [Streptomyces sp. NTH33]|nr:hypothetical protein [Streptomyces sp. NTH33]
MTANRRPSPWPAVAVAVAALVLGLATTAILAATGALRGTAPAPA